MSAKANGLPVAARHAVPLRDTEIGPLPEDWQVVRLGEVVEKTSQIDPQRTPDWEFKYVDVSCVDNESLRIVNYQICVGKDAPSRARKKVRTGDVCDRATISEAYRNSSTRTRWSDLFDGILRSSSKFQFR